jgi:hypothetical protein
VAAAALAVALPWAALEARAEADRAARVRAERSRRPSSGPRTSRCGPSWPRYSSPRRASDVRLTPPLRLLPFGFCSSSTVNRPCRRPVSRISMTRPAVAKQIQQILLRMAQQGQLRGRVSDDQLVGLLEQVRYLRSATALPPTPQLCLTVCAWRPSQFIRRRRQQTLARPAAAARSRYVPLSDAASHSSLTLFQRPCPLSSSSSARAGSASSILSSRRAPLARRQNVLTVSRSPRPPSSLPCARLPCQLRRRRRLRSMTAVYFSSRTRVRKCGR